MLVRKAHWHMLEKWRECFNLHVNFNSFYLTHLAPCQRISQSVMEHFEASGHVISCGMDVAEHICPQIFEEERFFCRALYHFQKTNKQKHQKGTVAALVLRLKQYGNQENPLD